MNVRHFIKQNREDWQRLEQLIRSLQRSRAAFSAAEIEVFHQLYQKAAQQLSYSQTYFPAEEVTVYLNELVGKAHNLLYKDQTTSMKQLRHFFSVTFVRLLSEQWRYALAAMLLFALGFAGSYIAVQQDPLHMYALLPGDIANHVDPNQLGSQDGLVESSLMSTTIMTNNIQVAMLAFAGGVTFGLLTVYILFYNGVIVGALAALFWQNGQSYAFWAYIVPHGMIELTAIFIAGGAGLMMGYKLFVPGRYSRGLQLKRNARRSVLLLLGTIPLFVIAGIVEGFITPAAIALEAKYGVALLTVCGLIAYMLYGFRKHHRTTTQLQQSNQ